ncbi:unnamed protein product [Phaeothamnion confervicola]
MSPDGALISNFSADHARLESRYPLKLIFPSRFTPEDCAWVYVIGYGGGLLSGDSTTVRCAVGAGATAALATQGTTKVYKRKRDDLSGARSSQSLRCTVADGALLALVPGLITCFADSSYSQSQEFRLAPGASLVLVDGMTSGRMKRGEAWAFRRFESRNTVYVGGELVFHDPVVLEDPAAVVAAAAARAPAGAAAGGAAAATAASVRARMHGMHALAVVVLIGPRVAAAATALLATGRRDGFDQHAAGRGSGEGLVRSGKNGADNGYGDHRNSAGGSGRSDRGNGVRGSGGGSSSGNGNSGGVSSGSGNSSGSGGGDSGRSDSSKAARGNATDGGNVSNDASSVGSGGSRGSSAGLVSKGTTREPSRPFVGAGLSGHVLTSVSTLRGGGGVVFRAAAEQTEDLHRILRIVLEPLRSVLGMTPYSPQVMI